MGWRNLVIPDHIPAGTDHEGGTLSNKDGSLSRDMSLKAVNTIMKERVWDQSCRQRHCVSAVSSGHWRSGSSEMMIFVRSPNVILNVTSYMSLTEYGDPGNFFWVVIHGRVLDVSKFLTQHILVANWPS